MAEFLNAAGVETLDADDVVHELIPPEERRRLAKVVFADAAARRELESRIHPLVKARLEAFLAAAPAEGPLRLVIVPLLFETHWDAEYDIICCVSSSAEVQVRRMMTARGYTREEAEARMAAQLPVEVKAARSHYVIRNDGTPAELRQAVAEFVEWLRRVK